MVPAKGRLVNLGEGQATALIGILDAGRQVSKVVDRLWISWASYWAKSLWKLWKAALPPAVLLAMAGEAFAETESRACTRLGLRVGKEQAEEQIRSQHKLYRMAAQDAGECLGSWAAHDGRDGRMAWANQRR